MALVLVVDDDRGTCDAIAMVVRDIGHESFSAYSFREGLEASRLHEFALVVVDVQLPDGSGLDLLPRLREKLPCPEVIIMTGKGDPDGAELAIRNGAWDYIQKPTALENIALALSRALQYQEEKQQHAVPVPLLRDMIIGNSLPLKECLNLVTLAASGNANTIICGESGTGKELFAAAIHNNSPRAKHNFVVVDCSALPGTLVESVLFGHEKGAYTGADRAQLGLVAQADNGTLFLDEIGELPMSIQKTFLRVIQERRYRSVGGRKEIVSNFSLVAATNRDLDAMVSAGEFRDDLLHRLKTIQIFLPPLREHKEDITALTQHYVSQFCLQHEMSMKGFTPDFFGVLEAYDWPGNVRELNQALERAMASAGTSPFLYPKDLPTEIRAKIARDSVPPPSFNDPTPHGVDPEQRPFPRLEDVRAAAVIETERAYLVDLMSHTDGNIPKAIDLSGLSRARFYALLKKHDIATVIRHHTR